MYLKPRCEKKLAEYCRIQDMEYYLPLRMERKVYQRRKVLVEKPVFPGYFFAAADEEQRLGLLKTNNIVRILVPPREQEFLGSCVALERGKRVRITGGPFMGIEGMVSSMKGQSKVCLNVEMIGRAVVVEAYREFLELID